MLAAFGPFEHLYTSGCYDATVLDPERIAGRMTEGPVWVAVSDESGPARILATVSARRDQRGLYVRGMGVHPDARRQGLGRRMLEEVERYARAEGLPCLWLSTTRFLTASQQLYLDFGFHPAPGPPDLFGVPLVSFEKALAPGPTATV